MQGKITKRSVDALEAPQSGETTLWDTEIKGFGCRIRPSGERTYILLYRAGSGRNAAKRRFTIGRHGDFTPEQARDEAIELRARINRGEDPAAVKREHREAETVADLAQRFLEDHVEAKRKVRTAAEYRRLLETLILPRIGSVKIESLTYAQVDQLHRALKKTPYQANRCVALLSAMLAKAEKWHLRPQHSNPAVGIERFREEARERMLSADELARLGAAIEAYENPYVKAAIKLLIFTGARLNEILTLEWAWIDFERGEARLPDSKTGRKTLHLPAPALAVLAELARYQGNPYVIVGHKHGTHIVNLQKAWRAIRSAAGLPDVRLHDLRHAFASTGAASGTGLYVIGKLLGHAQAATTQRYAHLAGDPLKAAASSIAGEIEAAMRGSGANVVPLKRGA